jgi:hypothetical protein
MIAYSKERGAALERQRLVSVCLLARQHRRFPLWPPGSRNTTEGMALAFWRLARDQLIAMVAAD